MSKVIVMDNSDSVLARVADTMRLKNRRLEVISAINQVDAGYPIMLSVGGVHARLSDTGREDLTNAIRADLLKHKHELECELWSRGVDFT